jgi:hypothetical protein
VSDLLLHQKHGARVIETADPLEDRRRDVVRKITDDRGAGPSAEVGVEDVLVHDFEAVVETRAEVADEVWVEFDGDHTRGALEKLFGEGAAAGADLYDQLDMVRTCGRGDSFEDGAFD